MWLVHELSLCSPRYQRVAKKKWDTSRKHQSSLHEHDLLGFEDKVITSHWVLSSLVASPDFYKLKIRSISIVVWIKVIKNEVINVHRKLVDLLLRLSSSLILKVFKKHFNWTLSTYLFGELWFREKGQTGKEPRKGWKSNISNSLEKGDRQ